MRDVNPGDRLRIGAGDWNDVRRYVRARRLGDGLEGGANPIGLLSTTQTIAMARNTGETDLERGDVAKVTAPIVLPADNEAEWWNRLSVDVARPATVALGDWLGVVVTPIPAGRIGRVVLAGVTQCRLNVIHASHVLAGAIGGDAILRTNTVGPHAIVWKESGTGTKRAIVQLGGSVQAQEWVTAWLTGASAISGESNRWAYDWQEVELHATSGWQVKSGGLDSTTDGLAWNGVEATNDGTAYESAGVSVAATAEATATLRAIGHGGLKPVYRMWREPVVGGAAGAHRWIFTEGNEIDVACVG